MSRPRVNRLRDRQTDYLEFRLGTPFARDESGLWPFQADCVQWLQRRQRPVSAWATDTPVALLPRRGSSHVRLGVLAADAPVGGAWPVMMEDSMEEEYHGESTLWAPLSDTPKEAVAVLLPPGFGKTAVATAFVGQLPLGTRALLVTKTGLLQQTEGEAARVGAATGTPPPRLARTRADFEAQLGEEGTDDFVITSYAVATGDGLLRSRAAFGVIIFDEAHAEASTFVRSDGRHEGGTSGLPPRGEWLRPYPHSVLLSGSAETLVERSFFFKSIDDSFYLTKGLHAPAALRMPCVEFRLKMAHPGAGFDLPRYILAVARHFSGEGRGCFAIALLWWAYERRTKVWYAGSDASPSPSELADGVLRCLTHSMRMRLRDVAVSAEKKKDFASLRGALLEMQSLGVVTAWLRLSEAAGPGPRRLTQEAPWPAGFAEDTWPAWVTAELPTCRDPERSAPLSTSRLLRLSPSLTEWRNVHAAALGRTTRVDPLENLARTAAESLRARSDGSRPKVLMVVPETPSREEVLRRLCNLPDRNRLCPHMTQVGADFILPRGVSREHWLVWEARAACTARRQMAREVREVRDECLPVCRMSHNRERFTTDGKRLRDPCERWCLHHEGGEENGELLSLPGLQGALVYVLTPNISERHRAAAVGHFNRNCHAAFRALRPLLEQAQRQARPQELAASAAPDAPELQRAQPKATTEKKEKKAKKEKTEKKAKTEKKEKKAKTEKTVTGKRKPTEPLTLCPVAARRRPASPPGFLRILGTADVAAQLELFLCPPQLNLAFGQMMSLGWNGQQRYNGLAFPQCEFDWDHVMQCVGRLQRPERAHAGKDLTISVSMPVLRLTLEDVLLSEVFTGRQREADARALGVAPTADAASVMAAARRKGGAAARAAAQRLLREAESDAM